MIKNFGSNILFSEITGEGEGMGSEESAAAEVEVAADSGATDISFPENWKDALPEDIRNEPSLGIVNDIQGLAKSYVHAQKQMGMDKVVIPGKLATDEDWSSFYRKLGHPDSLETYELAPPQDNSFDDGFITQIKEVAFNNNIAPKQMNALLEWYDGANREAVEARDSQLQTEIDERLGALKSELGQAYDQEVGKARGAFRHFFGESEDLKTWVEDSGLGDDPNFLKIFMKIGDLLAEDGIVGGDDGDNVKRPADVQSEINSIIGDTEHPYNNSKHPNHGQAVKEMTKMFEMIHR